ALSSSVVHICVLQILLQSGRPILRLHLERGFRSQASSLAPLMFNGVAIRHATNTRRLTSLPTNRVTICPRSSWIPHLPRTRMHPHEVLPTLNIVEAGLSSAGSGVKVMADHPV